MWTLAHSRCTVNSRSVTMVAETLALDVAQLEEGED